MKRQRGFSLIELMVTVAAGAVILSVGIPSFRTIILDNRLVTQANLIVTSINLARSSAVRYQRNATVCPSANVTANVPSCSSTTDWSNGWIVWVDKDRDLTVDLIEVISIHTPDNEDLSIESVGSDGFTYDARGFSTAGGDDLTLCDSRAAETGRLIRVNAVGRTNVAQQGCS